MLSNLKNWTGSSTLSIKPMLLGHGGGKSELAGVGSELAGVEQNPETLTAFFRAYGLQFLVLGYQVSGELPACKAVMSTISARLPPKDFG